MDMDTGIFAALPLFLTLTDYLHAIKNDQSPKAIHSSLSKFYFCSKENCPSDDVSLHEGTVQSQTLQPASINNRPAEKER